MAKDMTGETHKGSPFVEIFCGPVSSLISIDGDTGVPYPVNSETQIGFFQGKASSKFVENRLTQIHNEDGTTSHEWLNWSSINVTVRKHKDGVKRLNLTYVNRPHGWARDPDAEWEKFSITNIPGMISNFVSLHHINVFNQEIERLYKVNIGEPPFSINDYLVDLKHFKKDGFDPEKCYSSVEFEDEASADTCPAWIHRNATDYKPSNYWDNRNPYRYANNLAYPLYHFVTGGYLDFLMPFREEKTPKDIVESIFGKHNYRKDLVKACFREQVNTYKISFVAAFKDYVPIDWIIDMLNCNNRDSFLGWDENVVFQDSPPPLFAFYLGEAERISFPNILEALTMTQRRRLVKDLQTSNSKGDFADSMTVNDTLYAWHTLTQEYGCVWNKGDLTVRSWTELHDYLHGEITKRTVSDEPIKQVPLAKKIDALPKTNDLTFVLPETTHTLLNWGKTMKHCIGSYTREAKKGKYVFLGIMENDVLKGNMMIEAKDKNVVQILGKYNASLHKDLLEKVSSTLIEKKVLPTDAFENAYGFKD